MGDLHEIVSAETIGHLFALLAGIGPVAGALIGAALGTPPKQRTRSALNGLKIGLLGPLNWLLWRIYNALTDRNGLDSVVNIWINLALFITVGALLGLGVGWAQRSRVAAPKREKALPDSRQRPGDTP